MSDKPKPRRRCAWLSVSRFLAVVLIPLLAILPVASFAVSEDLPVVPEDGFGVVTRGPLEVVISQVGNVESANNLFMVNQCEWGTDLISLVPEGTRVKQGDVVAELDSSQLRQNAKQRMIQLVNAEAALKQAEEDFQIQELTNESQIARAELRTRLARLQLDGYLEAEYPQQLHELENAVALAEEELVRAKKQHDFSSEMVKLGYRTPASCEDQRLKLLKAKQTLQQARGRLDLLTDYAYQRTMTQLEAADQEAERELHRVQTAARAAILSRTVRLQARKRVYEAHQSALERLERSIAACVIKAPADGEVVHGRASSSRSSKGLEEGDRVRYLQTIALLPDRERMKVELRLHESCIRLIEKGHPAQVKVDSLPDITFAGTVSEVSTVPLSGRHPNYDLREYKVVVQLDVDADIVRQLAPGMSANVDVMAARRPDAIRVPIHSVAQVADRHVAFVRRGDQLEAREVSVGLSNDASIEILDGLQPGEEVVLRPRVTCAKLLTDLEGRYLAERSVATHSLDWTAR